MGVGIPQGSAGFGAMSYTELPELPLCSVQHASQLGASTVDSRQHEQDLAGFPDVEHSRDSALSVVAEGLEGDSPGVQPSLVHPPVKLAASESSGDAQGIGTSVHPSRQDLQAVRIPLLEMARLLGRMMCVQGET